MRCVVGLVVGWLMGWVNGWLMARRLLLRTWMRSRIFCVSVGGVEDEDASVEPSVVVATARMAALERVDRSAAGREARIGADTKADREVEKHEADPRAPRLRAHASKPAERILSVVRRVSQLIDAVSDMALESTRLASAR